MKVNVMDKVLIDIYNIRNLEYVNFWDLHGTSESKILVIPAIMINYDGGKNLTLCAKDKYFDTFVRKVVEVYNDEKNKILEDSLTDPFKLRQKIKIDDRTKKILDSGVLNEINQVYGFYDGKSGYDSSLLFQIDEIKSILPIIKYHIKKVFDNTDVAIFFNEEITGYRGYYTLTGKLNGVDRYFILSYEKVDNSSYEIGIQGLLSDNMPFNMSINFLKDSLIVNSFLGDSMISSSSEYLVTNEVVKERHIIKKNSIPILYENRDLEETDNEISNITDIDSNTKLRWFRLPWGAIYGINNNIIDVSESEKVIDRHNMFVQTSYDNFFIKEYFSKSYHRNETTRVEAIDVTLDEVRKNLTLVCIDTIKGIYALESNFLDKVAMSGYYAEKLSNNYFYHIIKSNDGIKGISREELIPVDKDNGILSNVDLVNKVNIYRLVKGD